jgi:hypothetical protein
VLRIWNGDLIRQRREVLDTIWFALHPSSGAARHLLPQGEKGSLEPNASDVADRSRGNIERLQSGTPSPLAGEGAARSAAGEGAP